MIAHIPDAMYTAFLASCIAVDRSPPPGDGPNDRMPLERTAALLEKQRCMVRMIAAMQPIEEG